VTVTVGESDAVAVRDGDCVRVAVRLGVKVCVAVTVRVGRVLVTVGLGGLVRVRVAVRV
jgi:hypothetical protein